MGAQLPECLQVVDPRPKSAQERHPEQVADQMPRPGEAAAESRVPFSSESLETLQHGDEACHISLAGGRPFANRTQVKVSGVTVDTKGSTLVASLAREKAAACCKRIPLADRSERLYVTAGEAFLFGPGGWTLSTKLWRRCRVLEGNWLRAMVPHRAFGVAFGTPGDLLLLGWLGPARATWVSFLSGSAAAWPCTVGWGTWLGPLKTTRPLSATGGSRPGGGGLARREAARADGVTPGQTGCVGQRVAWRQSSDLTGRPRPKTALLG